MSKQPKTRKGYRMCPKCKKKMKKLNKELHFCISCRIGIDISEAEIIRQGGRKNE